MKTAYHRRCLPNGEIINGPLVVETDEKGRVIDWHILDGEEPETVWRGGTYTILE